MILLKLIMPIIAFALYCCLVAAARADEASETMYEEWQKRKFEKN